ncbi:hypothetical protein Cgig2_015590 [Carnegiea gigantea]|uniref:Uncharacterized protein n=1 Tax=Carnegiea gigantea TaxID=171969 RepID=A0A9Q1JXS0_9CARY|nr:hypothetical protein Cgig2_015590 [Carnegiea gigantea]
MEKFQAHNLNGHNPSQEASSSVEDDHGHGSLCIGKPPIADLPAVDGASGSYPLLPYELVPPPLTPPTFFSCTTLEATQWNDLYLELEDLNDLVMSTDSSKERKLEEGDECSSHSLIKFYNRFLASLFMLDAYHPFFGRRQPLPGMGSSRSTIPLVCYSSNFLLWFNGCFLEINYYDARRWNLW